MSRPKQCSSCLYFIPANEISRDILDVISTLYDGWCKHYGEERDRDDETCEHYAKQVNRRKKQ